MDIALQFKWRNTSRATNVVPGSNPDRSTWIGTATYYTERSETRWGGGGGGGGSEFGMID